MLKTRLKKLFEEYAGPAYFGLAMAVPFAINLNPEFGYGLLILLGTPVLFMYFLAIFKNLGGKNE